MQRGSIKFVLVFVLCPYSVKVFNISSFNFLYATIEKFGKRDSQSLLGKHAPKYGYNKKGQNQPRGGGGANAHFTPRSSRSFSCQTVISILNRYQSLNYCYILSLTRQEKT